MTDLGDLRDTFGSTSALWTYGELASVTGGRLRTAADYTEDLNGVLGRGDARTTAGSLTDSHALVELAEPANRPTTRTYLMVYTGTDPALNALQWAHYWDTFTGLYTLEASTRVAGVKDVLASIPYQPAEHRWLQIREASGAIYWDTSPDGFSWSTEASSTVSLALGSARILLGAASVSPSGDLGVAYWDNLNSPLILNDPVTLGPEGSPYLAVDVQPDNREGTFQLDVSRLDEYDALAWTDLDAGAWVNVVCDVLGISCRRGATQLQGVLTHTEAGTVSVRLQDTAGVFDPMQNRDAIHKGTPLRLRAWGTDTAGQRWDAVLFTGEVDRVLGAYQREDVPRVTLTGVDLVGPLAAWRSEGAELPGVGAGDDLRTRTDRVLTEVGRGVVSGDSDAAFTATLPPSQLTQAWQDLQLATEAELGRLWVDRHNRLVLRNRGSQLTGPIRGTLSDIHGEAPAGVHCCVADAAVVYGPEQLVNLALGKRRHAVALGVTDPDPDVLVRREDEYSQTRYGTAAVERYSLELQTDHQVERWGEALVMGHITPELRVDSVQPLPSPQDLDSALEAWPAVLQTDLGDRWLFQYHPQGRPPVERAVGVVGVELEADPDSGWSITWLTADAPQPGVDNPSGWFLVDVSELDGGEVLAPYSVPL